MKKKIVFCLLLSVLMVSSICPYRVAASNNDESVIYNEDSEKDKAYKDMLNLQTDVSDTLTIDGNKYRYNEEIIREIVNNSNFDFSNYNKVFGTNYTIESLSNQFIIDISNFEIKPQTRSSSPAYTCGLNATYGGWNYERRYWDKNKTTYEANRYSAVTDSAMLSNLIAGTFGILNVYAGAAAYVAIGWATDFSKAITKANYNECGIVIDFNAYTNGMLYYEANQKTFPGHF